jgi:hypothetical protein
MTRFPQGADTSLPSLAPFLGGDAAVKSGGENGGKGGENGGNGEENGGNEGWMDVAGNSEEDENAGTSKGRHDLLGLEDLEVEGGADSPNRRVFTPAPLDGRLATFRWTPCDLLASEEGTT